MKKCNMKVKLFLCYSKKLILTAKRTVKSETKAYSLSHLLPFGHFLCQMFSREKQKTKTQL